MPGGEVRTSALSGVAVPSVNRVTHMIGFSSCTVLFSDNRAVAYLHGELDACSVTCLRMRLAPIAMTGRGIVVDLAGLGFMDTAGLIALIDLQREATRAGGSLRLAKPQRPIRRLLKFAGARDTFAIVDRVPSGSVNA